MRAYSEGEKVCFEVTFTFTLPFVLGLSPLGGGFPGEDDGLSKSVTETASRRHAFSFTVTEAGAVPVVVAVAVAVAVAASRETRRCAYARFWIPMSMLRILIPVPVPVPVPVFVLLLMQVLICFSGSGDEYPGNSSFNLAMRDAFVPEDWIPVAWAMRCSWDALRVVSHGYEYELRRGDEMRISSILCTFQTDR